MWADNSGTPQGPPLEILNTVTVPYPNQPVLTIPASGTTLLETNKQYWIVLKAESQDFSWLQSGPEAFDEGVPITPGVATTERRVSRDAGTNWTALGPNMLFSFSVFGSPSENAPSSLLVDTAIDEADTPATNGSGKTSLREAMRDVAEGGTITFAAELSGQTIRLVNGSLHTERSLTIDASTLLRGICLLYTSPSPRDRG